MTRTVAVICAYWPERFDNVRQAVEDLYNGTVLPDRVIVLNNNTQETLKIAGADVINMGFNSECRGKFIAPLLDIADYYLLLDDDTSVRPKTLECLLRYARRGCCFGYLGCYINKEGSFHHGDRIWPRDAKEETPVQAFCGCAMFMSFDALIRMLILEEKVRLNLDKKWPTEGDDIIAGLANKSSVIPMALDEEFKDLGYKGVAMVYSVPDYYEMRDEFVQDVMKVLETFEIPEF